MHAMKDTGDVTVQSLSETGKGADIQMAPTIDEGEALKISNDYDATTTDNYSHNCEDQGRRG